MLPTNRRCTEDTSQVKKKVRLINTRANGCESASPRIKDTPPRFRDAASAQRYVHAREAERRTDEYPPLEEYARLPGGAVPVASTLRLASPPSITPSRTPSEGGPPARRGESKKGERACKSSPRFQKQPRKSEKGSRRHRERRRSIETYVYRAVDKGFEENKTCL